MTVHMRRVGLLLIVGAVIVAVEGSGVGRAQDDDCDPALLGQLSSMYGYVRAVECGLIKPDSPPPPESGGPASSFGSDKNVSVPPGSSDGTYPNVTQAESQIASNASGTTVVALFGDFRNSGATPACYAGGSYSTDSGSTWQLLSPSPFCESSPYVNYGDPAVVYDKRHATFIATWITLRCGGGTNRAGVGVWTSTNGSTWTVGPCAHTPSGSPGDDRESAWVDNNPASQYYGRTYVTFNDFSTGAGALKVVHSDDGGATWSTAVQIYSGGSSERRRNVQVTVGQDGAVLVATMDENGGGLNDRQNFFFRSTGGGELWTTQIPMGSTFSAPGAATCQLQTWGAMFNPGDPTDGRWRYMGWGEIGTSKDQSGNSIVHYVYTQHGTDANDPGDIYYVRSTDNGTSWSSPVKLNTDTGVRAQWQPSLAFDASGKLLVTWHDARNTTGTDYEVYARKSVNHGVAWGTERVASDAPIPLPTQPEGRPGFACFAGDYNRSYMDASHVHITWTDGRNQIGGYNQADVYYDRCDVINPESTSFCY